MRNENHTGTKFADTLISYLESLIAKRDFAGVTNYYEKNRNQLEDTGEKSDGIILKQVAIAYASSSNFSSALRTIRLAQNQITALGDSLELADVCIVLAGILKNMGEMKEAERAYRDAESIYRRNDNQQGQSRALNLLAGLFFRQNDYKSALPPLLEALEIAQKINDNKKIAYMMGNLGRIYSFLGNVAEARHHLKVNMELSSKLSDMFECIRAELSLGYLEMSAGEYESASKHFENAKSNLESNNSQQLSAICLTYIGELAYLQNRLDDAQLSLNLALSIVSDSQLESTMKARVKRQLAELALRKKNYSKASRLAAQALIINEKCQVVSEIGAIWRIKAIIASETGNKDEARDCFATAIRNLEESGIRFELVETLVAAGNSEALKTKKRLTFLFRAEEFYSSEGLTIRLSSVEKTIEQVSSESSNSPKKSNTLMTQFPVDSVKYLTKSKEINQFISQLPLIADADIPLLLTGETGVGKDHLAKHYHSMILADKPYKAINCASLPETLLESELFGYKKGAFTDASNDKEGLIVSANGGILFLDEIGDMPFSLQAKLLGVLEHRRLTPLGSTEEVVLDIKLVTATNKNLEEMVEKGTFRRDLYYRISGMTFNIPPLRDRKEDIPLLMEHYFAKSRLLDDSSKLPTELVHQFLKHSWPGNIRELSNKIKRLGIMAQMVAEGDLVELSMTLFDFEKQESKKSFFGSVKEFERKLLVDALLAADGNKSEAARILGLHEATVRTKLKRYGIDQPSVS